MRYTEFGTTGREVSRLGFGCMRLPMTDDGTVDREKAAPLLRRGVDLGVTYFDTAIFYCNGDSQRAVGEALEGLRDRVILSTKNHLHSADADEWRKQLDDSLRFLRTDHLDVYNFHGLSWDAFTKHIDGPDGKLRLMERARDEGLVRHICCSFHDRPESLFKLVDTGVFTAVTVQYNMLSRSLEDAIAHAREKNVAVVVMGPVGGGRLGVDSDRIRELTDNAVESTPEAALRFVLACDGVTVALSGMSTMEQLEENVRVVSEKDPFTPEQIDAIDAEAERVREKTGVPCPACGYCLPCPAGVDIPENFRIYNENLIYGLDENYRKQYAALPGKASACIECGACSPKCPQKHDIPRELRKVMATLDTAYGDFGSGLTIRSAESRDTLMTRCTVKNLRDRPLEPTVTVELADCCPCEPREFSAGRLDAFGGAGENLRVTVPDGVGALDGRLVTRSGEEEAVNPLWTPFFIAPEGEPRRHAARITAEDVEGDRAASDSYDVLLCRDDEALHVVLDISSPLTGLEASDARNGAHVEVYVDMRAPERLGLKQWEAGVEQLFLPLGDGAAEARSEAEYALDLRRESVEGGVRLSFSLRFDQFAPAAEDGARHGPDAAGLDIMYVVADENGADRGHPTYGGSQGLYQNASLFTTVFFA